MSLFICQLSVFGEYSTHRPCVGGENVEEANNVPSIKQRSPLPPLWGFQNGSAEFFQKTEVGHRFHSVSEVQSDGYGIIIETLVFGEDVFVVFNFEA